MRPAVSTEFRSQADHSGPWRRLGRFGASVAGLAGWRRTVLALLLGALAVLALPPVYLLPALVFAFTGLVWLIDGARTWRSALLTGYVFGLGYFTAGLYWVANALLTFPEQFGLVAPLAPVGLALILAPFPAAACALARLAVRPGVGRVLTFAAAWTLLEWVRSWAFTGFPWNLIGSVWAFSDAMIQPAALIGTYGLSLATVAAAAMPAVLVRGGGGGLRRWRPVLAALACLPLLYLGGVMRLAAIGDPGHVDGVWLRLVQPNIPQNLKWRRELVDMHLLEQVRMGAQPADPPPTHVIWSEAAAPLFLAHDQERLRLIGAHTPGDGLSIVGTLRTTPPGEEPFRVWNSLLAIGRDGSVAGFYDKTHLVPFGEYMPLREVLGLGSVAGGSTDFSRGPGIQTLDLPGLPAVGPLICYEVIFPGSVVEGGRRPRWLLNLTNDGWYGISAGPHQHLVAARLRAVEEGLPLVRVANTGISAIIDPLGRVEAELGLGQRGVLDGPLPLPLQTPTLFARTGPWGVLVLCLFIGAIGVRVAQRQYPLYGELSPQKTG